MKLNIYQKVFLGYFITVVIFWVVIVIEGSNEGFYGYLHSFLYSLIPLLAGVIVMKGAHIWDGFKSAVGKAVFFIGLGVFCWGAGSMVWAYYNFFVGIAVPYPSLADIFYVPSIIFYGLGIVYLSGATGAKFSLRNRYAKVFVALAPIVVLVISYYLLVIVARGGILFSGGTLLKVILDIVYPLGDFLGLLIGVIISGLSFKYLGGRFKYNILAIFLGIGVMIVADATFSYTTTVGIYYTGNFVDLMFSVGTFLLSFGVLGFIIPNEEIKLSMLRLDAKKNLEVFNQILVRIIKKQEHIMGHIAFDEASRVPGLTIDQSGNVTFSGDEKEVINRLVIQYGKLFGKASYEVSKEAVKDLITEMTPEEVPTVFNKNLKIGKIKKVSETLYNQNLELAEKLEKTEKSLETEKVAREKFIKESGEVIENMEKVIKGKN